MSRPGKEKKICRMPVYNCFVPAVDDETDERCMLLGVDEYEAVRLIDYLGLTQKQCAEQMQVGRATVQAIYANARRKIARFLVEGARLKITGGQYRICSDKVCTSPDRHCRAGGSYFMKVAVTYENGMVFQHFGHTKQFKIYDIQDGKIIKSEIVDTNGSGHGALGGFLSELGVDILICGGIGGGARNALAECGIELYPGAQGQADSQIEAFLAGTLNYDPDTVCSDHHHAPGEGCHGHEGNSCGHGGSCH